MEYLHKSDMKVHGDLKTSNCLINHRWTLKISDFGFAAYRIHNYVTENEKFTGQS